MTRPRDPVLQELAREEARLADLERTRDEVRARIESLRSELTCVTAAASLSPRLPLAVDCKPPRTTADKLQLFRSLFRGRGDMFPLRFVSKKTGKAGYAPACFNKWEPGCLLKSGGKCSDCPNQDFVPVSDQLLIEHLQGRHVMGVYPLLEEETCWFLAVDFDKGPSRAPAVRSPAHRARDRIWNGRRSLDHRHPGALPRSRERRRPK